MGARAVIGHLCPCHPPVSVGLPERETGTAASGGVTFVHTQRALIGSAARRAPASTGGARSAQLGAAPWFRPCLRPGGYGPWRVGTVCAPRLEACTVSTREDGAVGLSVWVARVHEKQHRSAVRPAGEKAGTDGDRVRGG